MPTLIDAATTMIELLDQYDCDADLAAARSALNDAVTAELLTAGTHVTIPRGGRPPIHGPAARAKVLRLAREGLTYDEIVRRTGVSIATCKRWASEEGVRRNGRKKDGPKDDGGKKDGGDHRENTPS